MPTQAAASAQPWSDKSPDIDHFLADPSDYFGYSFTQMMNVPREHLDRLQLAGLKRRFSQFRGALPMLDKLADRQGIDAIDQLNDVLPLLFDHAIYKSYPTSLLDQHRYAQLTAWLNKLTTVDLSRIDVSACRGIDDWMMTLNRQTPLAVVHTSGTSGTMSFLPWSKQEWTKFARKFALFYQRFGQDSPVQKPPLNIDCVHPYFRSGGYSAGALNDALVEVIAGGEERFHAAYPGRLSADLTLLAARRRAAMARGQLDQLVISPELAARHAEFESLQRDMPGHVARFFDTMRIRLAGKRIFMVGTSVMLFSLAESGLKQGMRKLFSPDSLVCSGGGGKGQPLPDNHAEMSAEFFGVERVMKIYGMSEMTGQFPTCEHGHYHALPWIIPFILDLDTNLPLPRSGTVTGRFAFYDLLTDMRWGGFVTGDEVTLVWDTPCPCGQPMPYLTGKIRRVSEKRDDGEEKINCAAAPDAYAEALGFLNEDTTI